MVSPVTLEQLEEQVLQLSPLEQRRLLARISERLSALPLAITVDAEEDYDFTQTPTWQLCGALRVREPEPAYVVGLNEKGEVITNYAEHIDDVLYG